MLVVRRSLISDDAFHRMRRFCYGIIVLEHVFVSRADFACDAPLKPSLKTHALEINWVKITNTLKTATQTNDCVIIQPDAGFGGGAAQ